MRSCFALNSVIKIKRMSYSQQHFRMYMKLSELLNTFRTKFGYGFATVSNYGKMLLEFIDKNVKINTKYMKQNISNTFNGTC